MELKFFGMQINCKIILYFLCLFSTGIFFRLSQSGFQFFNNGRQLFYKGKLFH